MKGFTIRGKLVLSFLCVAAFAVLIGSLGLSTLLKVDLIIGELADDITPSIKHLGDIESASLNIIEKANEFVLVPAAEDREQKSILTTDLFALRVKLKKAFNNYQRFSTQSLKDNPHLREFRELISRISQRLDDLYAASDVDQQIKKKIVSLLTKLCNRVIIQARFASELKIIEVEDQQLQSKEIIKDAYRFNFLVMLAMLLVAGALSLLMSEKLAGPIVDLRDKLQKYGAGQRDIKIAVDSGDEIGELAGTFKEMIENLNQTTVSRTFFENIINSMLDPLVVTNSGFKAVMVNSALIKLSGYSEKELIGNSVDLILGLGATEVLKTTIGSPQGALFDSEYRFFTKGGETRPISLSVSEMQETKDRDKEIILVIRDLSAEKRAAMEKDTYREKLVRAEQLASLGTMSAIVAHKINQPLTTMLLFVQQSLRSLMSIDCPEQVMINLNNCVDEIRKVSSTVKEILQYTRKPVPKRVKNISLREIATKTYNTLKESAERQNLTLIFEGMEALPTIFGAKDELEELFYVLTQNSIQAAVEERECELVVSGKASRDDIELIFLDNCAGIDKGAIDKIFEPFFTNKPMGKGTGLGLSIANQIVKGHNGSIEVESKQGEGTLFRISLPIDKN